MGSGGRAVAEAAAVISSAEWSSSGVALVTGAGARIGRAIALALAQRGFAVIVHFKDAAAPAQAVVDQIVTDRGRAVALGADLADMAAMSRLVDEGRAALGPITVLVNNASIFERDEIADMTAESWQQHLDINLRAPVFLTQRFAAQLPADLAGHVVNIVDQRVLRLTPHFVSYTLSKAALWTATQTLAMALAPQIRVNAVAPGPVLPSVRQTSEQFAKLWQSTPLGRGATPEEIASAVLFLIAAPAVTGQLIAVDGGQHLPWPMPRTAALEA